MIMQNHVDSRISIQILCVESRFQELITKCGCLLRRMNGRLLFMIELEKNTSNFSYLKHQNIVCCKIEFTRLDINFLFNKYVNFRKYGTS